MVEFLLRASRANHELFPHLQARIQFTKGMATSAEDALSGRWIDGPDLIPARVFWACSGGQVRRDQVYEPELIARRERKEGMMTVRDVATSFSVWNATIEITQEPGMTFYVSKKGDLTTESWTPLNCGMSHPVYERADVIRKQLGGEVTYEGDVELDGRRLPVLRFRRERGMLQIDRYWIDPDRGYNPVRVETYYDDDASNAAQVLVLGEFREFPNGGWLPMLARYVNLKGSRISGYEAKVEHIETEQPVPETFQLSVGPYCSGLNRIKQTGLGTSAKGVVGLAHFDSDGKVRAGQNEVIEGRSFNAQRVATTTLSSEVPQWPFAGPLRGRWVVPSALGICVVGLLAILVYHRKRA